jgi:hypothetical protein
MAPAPLDPIRPVANHVEAPAASTPPLLLPTGSAQPAQAADAERPNAPSRAAQTADKSAQSDALRQLQLHFRIDPETQDITVLVVDRASRRIVRTIPSDELRRLEEGSLFELLA